MIAEIHDLPRVLCVDDDPMYLEALKIQLRLVFQVVTATCGADGLSEMERGGPFAVVISDLRMPHMDGLSFLSDVQSRWPATTRILLTGMAEQGGVPQAPETHLFARLTKPCPRDKLLAVLEGAMREHEKFDAEKLRPAEGAAYSSPSTLQTPFEMRCDEKFARLLPPTYLSSLESHPHAVYGLWPDLSLAYVNARWFSFAEENGGASVRRDWPVGRSMLDAVPEVARDWYKKFYESALDTDRANPNVHEYECCSPERYRKYVMTVHSLASGLHKGLIAVHSLLAEAPIEATSYTPLPAVRELYTQPDGLIRQCMHCRRVNRAYESRVWDWVPDWVREPQENVTHALCDPCLAHFYSRDDVGSA